MIKNYIKAARVRTLPLSISGIILGSILGNQFFYEHSIVPDNSSLFFSAIFWLAILTTIGFQILSNFANDYGDGIKGSDNDRTGEMRMVASGTISPKQMKIAMIITAIITFMTTLLLIYVAFGVENFAFSTLFLGLGIASITAAIKYTVGDSAYVTVVLVICLFFFSLVY